jgi:hypothetical protein
MAIAFRRARVIRTRWRWCVGLVVAVATFALPSVASAWSQDYVQCCVWLTPAEYRGSIFNYGVHFNSALYTFYTGSGDVMGLTLCYSGGAGCYSVVYDNNNDGYVEDNRSISYGAAFCGGAYWNQNSVYVKNCHAEN